MGNLLQYTDKSSSIDNKLASLIAEIDHDYQNGNIRTETEYYYRIKTMINHFYATLNKPGFQYRPAMYAPISSEYNSMISEAYNDMKYIIDDCQNLSQSLEQSFTDCELSRTMMQNNINYLAQKIDNIIESVQYNQTEGLVVFTELFNNSSSQGNRKQDGSCFMDTKNGILILGYKACNYIPITGITIDNEKSNGLPGNTHCVNTENSEMHFIGQDGLHNNVKAMYDGNLDTWFEFELFSIPEKTREQCNNYGFDYEEGVSWIGDGPLVLQMTIHVDGSYKGSWFSITPYLSNIKGVNSCIIKECNIITLDNNVYKVAENISFNELKLFTFPGKNIKEIKITLVQDSSYLTQVGHFYFTDVNTKNMSIFQDFDTSDTYTRVEGKTPSVSLLGVKYDPTTQWVDYNNSTSDIEASYAKSGLFTIPISTIQKKAGQEIVDAYRYMIGIRDMSLKSYVFNDKGTFVSEAYTTDEPIDSVVLDVDEYIPGDNPEILKYYLTFDGGVNWHQIYPMKRSYAGVYRYTINNDTIANLMTTTNKERRTKNLNMLSDVHSVQLKIEMNKPTGVENPENTSPIVYKYKLIIETGGENIEY